MKKITVYNLDDSSEMIFCDMSKTRALINAYLIENNRTADIHDNNVFLGLQSQIIIGDNYMMLGSFNVRYQ